MLWDLWLLLLFFFFKQKTAYEMRISDWSSDVCSSDLMDRERAKFVDGAAERGTRKRDAEELFDHIAKFAGYGFNKSHAAAYSQIGRASCRERVCQYV